MNLRVPPHSVEAEQSVLGGLLLDNGSWDKIGDLLSAEDFYNHAHKIIFNAICSLIMSAKPADVLTVHDVLKNMGTHDDVGGIIYLNELAQCVPNAANVRRYSEIIRERSILRSLIAASDEIATSAFNSQGKLASAILDAAEAKIMAIGESRSKSGFVSMDNLVVKLLDHVQEMADRDGTVIGAPTGFVDLDRLTCGLQPGDLVILAARPSMGKTALAINIAQHVAKQSPVAVFSMEMGASQLAMRIVSSIGRIDQNNLRTGKLTDDEWGRLSDAVEAQRQASIFIDESPGLSHSELRAKARRLARQSGGLGLIVIDYLQLMGGGGSDNRSTELGEISRSLKGLAKELNCPVLALSQLNRGVEARADKRPLMSDLRESGAIEQDADLIMFIYRDEYYNKGSPEPGVAEIIIAKHRCGPTGSVKLSFSPSLTKFDNLAADYTPREYKKSDGKEWYSRTEL